MSKRPARKPTKRENDPRVVEVLAAFDSIAVMPERHRSIRQGHGDVWLCYFMQAATLSIADGYLRPGGWTTEGARAVLVAFLLNCPAAYLKESLKGARSEIESIHEHDESEPEAVESARPIVVESHSRLDRLDAAALRLESVAPAALDKVLAAAEAFVATYDHPDEPIGEFNARLQLIGPGRAQQGGN